MVDATPDPTSPSAPPPRRRALRALLALLAAGAAALGWAAVIEPQRLEVTQHLVGAGPTQVRVAHLTDLHVAAVGRRERRLVEAVRDLRPDLVVITGDTVVGIGDGFAPEAVTQVLRDLEALRPPLGTFAIKGNHEDWVGPRAASCFAAAGVPLLEGARPLLGGRLVLHGVPTPHPPPAPVATAAFDLVLCHYPAILPRVAGPGVELILAGHTHGGQVCLPGGHPLALPFESGGFAAGWFEQAGTRMYVSRGVGTSVLPLRFACRPEVALHSLDLVPRRDGDGGRGAR